MTIATMICLTLIILAALLVPFLWHKAEEQLEIFLFILGVLAVSVSNNWSYHLIKEAFSEPVAISLAVLATSVLFKEFKKYINIFIEFISNKLGLRLSIFICVLTLAFLSSVITAI